MIDVEMFIVALRRHKDANGKAAPIYLADTLGEEIKIIEEALNYAGRRREWVGLTEEDMVMCESEEYVRFVRAIKAKLKEKNNAP